ncbi:MAG: hypothetical protein HY518_05705, partial [Candidatus Aenigmarchaeota archaeon]|nr:hypothetical protein [Candidatus Aenigmarchaeota archaeon]
MASVSALTSSEVGVTRITSASAQINWMTDEPSTGRVRFGTTASLGLSAVHQEQRTNHSILLTGLDTDTVYFFELVSQTSGAEAVDDNNGSKYSFRTEDTIPPPKVENVRESSKTSSSIILTWDASGTNDTSYYLVYESGALLGNVSAAMPLLFNHSSLVPGQAYSYKVRAVDTSGNQGQLSDSFITSAAGEDTTPPSISTVEYQNATNTQITVVFTTDENATAEIRYGETTLATVEKNDAFLTGHALKLTNLRKNATYSYILISCDASRNCANISSLFSAGRDVTAPFINVTLPRFINKVVVDIIGSTEPFSEISLFVNNLNLPLRVLGSSETGGQGRIALRGITLRKDNVIKITARDKAGNTNQQLFDVSVDVDEPVVAFNDLPNITSRKNLTIAGSVNEPVIIRVFVRPLTNERETQPGTVTGFRNASIGENSVALAWNRVGDNDFSHYILRRGDVGAIAVLQPSTYTSYTDILVDAGKQYTYTLSYMNKFGNEGNESAPLTVRLPSTGIITGIKPQAANIIQDFRNPNTEINASGDFTMGVMLGSNGAVPGNNEDIYEVKIEVTDLAGNRVTQTRHVQLDTKIPDIRIISPPNNAVVFENYANEINIEGKTEPGARVHLFVGRTPFNDQNLSFDISGLKKEIESIGENSLDADCNAIVRSR